MSFLDSLGSGDLFTPDMLGDVDVGGGIDFSSIGNLDFSNSGSWTDPLGDFFDFSAFSPPAGGGWLDSLSKPLSFGAPAQSGFKSFLRDATGLVDQYFASKAHYAQVSGAADLAEQQQRNQLETLRTTPNIWLVLGLGAAGVFALQVMDRRK